MKCTEIFLDTASDKILDTKYLNSLQPLFKVSPVANDNVVYVCVYVTII